MMMTGRKKLMLGTWSAPSEGIIKGVMFCDVQSKTLDYIARARETTGEKVTITSVVVAALGRALSESPELNGRIVGGGFYSAGKEVDIGCLVALDGGKHLANAKITHAHSKPVHEVAKQIRAKADRLRSRADADFERTRGTLDALPASAVGPVASIAAYLATLGLSIPALGVRPHPFGTCMVTSVGMLGES